jgi:hypothetical protein
MCLEELHQSSTNASSRVFLNAGSNTITTKNAAAAKRDAESGRVTNTV